MCTTMRGNYRPHVYTCSFLFFFRLFFSSWDLEPFDVKKIWEVDIPKDTLSFLPVSVFSSVHSPASLLGISGSWSWAAWRTIQKVSAADSWENAPFLFHALSLERRQQQLLTWPYRSQMLQGNLHCINSDPCLFSWWTWPLAHLTLNFYPCAPASCQKQYTSSDLASLGLTLLFH